MRRLFIVLFLCLLIASCQRQARIIDYKPFSPNGIEDLITNNIHHYKTAITAMRKNDMWKNYVQQFPDDLYTDKKYKFAFCPGFMQGGPFMVLQVDFTSDKECKDFFNQHSKNYQLQFNNIDSLRNTDYCTVSSLPDSTIQQYSVFRFFEKNKCFSSDPAEVLGGIYSGIFLGKNNRRVYCFTEDGRL